MPALDQLGHLAIEEGEQQRADVRAVDIRIGHDDDAVVAQLVGVVLLLADTAPERGDERRDLGRGEQLVEARALDVEDLALQRQDRLELAVAPLLGRAAGGVAFHQVELALGGIALLAVGQLARQPHAVEHSLAPGHLARLAGGFAGSGRFHDLYRNGARVDRVLVEEFAQLLGHDLLHHRAHF
jgi:hypothetical protein